MPEDRQSERPKSPSQGDDRTPDKPIGQVAYAADQQKEGRGEGKDKQRNAAVVLSSASPGEDRTSGQTIGEIAYALHSDEREGGAGEPQTSSLEPEKQGGIGGP
jgi:hypothetical protein